VTALADSNKQGSRTIPQSVAWKDHAVRQDRPGHHGQPGRHLCDLHADQRADLVLFGFDERRPADGVRLDLLHQARVQVHPLRRRQQGRLSGHCLLRSRHDQERVTISGRRGARRHAVSHPKLSLPADLTCSASPIEARQPAQQDRVSTPYRSPKGRTGPHLLPTENFAVSFPR